MSSSNDVTLKYISIMNIVFTNHKTCQSGPLTCGPQLSTVFRPLLFNLYSQETVAAGVKLLQYTDNVVIHTMCKFFNVVKVNKPFSL